VKPLKPLKWAGIPIGVLAVAFAGAQFVRPASANLKTDASHAIRAQFAASPNGLVDILDRACSDCHSNTMASRWYAQVAPFSFLIARGAQEGRKAVNFSEWTAYSPEQQRALLVASCTDARSGKMPVRAYLRFRPDAKLSARDVETICGAAR
jgi:heme-binding protein